MGTELDDSQGVINLRTLDQKSVMKEPESGFEVHEIDGDKDMSVSIHKDAQKSDVVTAPADVDLNRAVENANDKVKVRFDKFIALVASRAYEEIIEKYANHSVIIDADLLADLAHAEEDEEEPTGSWIFVGGVGLGVLLTWFLLKFVF